jgi:hypothetical protein
MGSLTAQYIIRDRVIEILNDNSTTPVKWTFAQLLRALNGAQRMIQKLKPDAYPTVGVVQLAEGTKQSLPSGGFLLVDVTRNMGSAGTTPGKSITKIDRETMDQERPGWHSDSKNAVVRHYVYDSSYQEIFYVWPPQPASSQNCVELIYSKPPTEVSVSDWVAGSNAITVPDTYENEIISWILFIAYSRNSRDAKNMEEASVWRQRFFEGLGMTESAIQTKKA